MKRTALILALAFTSNAMASEANCLAKIESTIKSAAKLMGFVGEFQTELSEGQQAGTDMLGNLLTKYTASTFFIDEGYISGSGASVVVRPDGDTCEVIKLNVSTGF